MRKTPSDAADILTKKRHHKLWLKVVSVLGCAVVFVTTYALILPAITMEKQPVCGLEEHIHDDACYMIPEPQTHSKLVCSPDRLGVHTHTARCYDAGGNLVCAQADYLVHYHDEACYDEYGYLVCPLPEIYLHTHTDACYAESAPAGHIHDESCYASERGVLICPLDESAGHAHDDSCYDENGALICGLEESEGHVHTDACYEQTEVLVCTPEESGADETPERALICRQPEVHLHQHTDSCFVGGECICGMLQTYAHQHDDHCFLVTQEQAEPVLICDLEEHIHTDDCYAAEESESNSDPTADVETQTQWEATMRDVRLTGEYRQDVLTIARSQLGYTESSRNYVLDAQGMPNGYTRYGAWYGDLYGDWCAMFVSFCLHYAGVPEADLPHESNCENWITLLSQRENYFEAHPEQPDDPFAPPVEPYIPASGDLIFFSIDGSGISDHVGLVTEYLSATETEPARVRTIEGNNANSVRYCEYEWADRHILGYAQLPEQAFFCSKTGHAHSPSCGMSACTTEEHIHTDACFAASQVQQLSELSYTGADFSVLVRYGEDAALPEGVTLSVHEIAPDSAAYRTYCDRSLSVMQSADEDVPQTLVFARFLDISFVLNGVVYEPAAPIEVTITYDEAIDTDDAVGCKAVHFGQNGTELLDVATEQTQTGETSFTHTQDSFSVVGSVVTATYAAGNPTDIGLNKLPVDYYVCIDGEWVCVGSTRTGWYNNWDGTEGWTNYNRDYITLEQAISILGPYGFSGNAENPSRVTAYQQKSDNTKIYSDTDTVQIPENSENGTKILPLSRNASHAGYNLYYLPANTAKISGLESSENLNKTANAFYTVKVYDAVGELLTSAIVPTGGSFSYDVSDINVTSWLAAYSNGSTVELTDSIISLTNITSTVTISPKPAGAGVTGSHSVTFKAYIDNQWQTVGSLPYYYSGSVNGETRAYITSDMAAQFFGPYGYKATDAPGYQFGYSYNDIYTLFYANGTTQTNFCMDVAGGKLQEGQIVQLYTGNGSDAQIFRVWDAGSGYCFITPIGNSAFHVNAYGYVSGDPSSTQLKLSSAGNANSQWKVDTGSDGRTTFWSAIAPDDQVIDLNNANMTNGGKLQLWHSTGGARYWYMVQKYRVSNNTVSEPLDDGTYKIGLTVESNGDIVCYYLPGVTSASYSNVAESALAPASSCWDVTVRDDLHLVYSDGELSTMRQTVVNGGSATVTVENADGVLWSCVGKNGGALNVTSSQEDGYTTFTITNITQPVEVIATGTNPTFTVQYYANIDRYILGSSGNLDIINTSGKKLPTNSGSQSLLWLTLENTGSTTDQNKGNATSLMRVKSEKQLTKMYTDGTYNFAQHPGLEYFDKLWGQANYKLDAVLVLKDGKSASSTNDDDWWWYQVNQRTWGNITFTNLASEENAPRQEGVKQSADGTYCILLQEGTVLRLRYETGSQTYTNQANFHDYDITSGQNPDGTWRSGITGINISGNYSGGYNTSDVSNVFAFGNANCETGLGLAQWSGNNINAYNGTNVTLSDGSKSHFGNDVYRGCTFGLVTRLDGNGNLVWNSSIKAPYLFDDGTANGKHTYNNGSLSFNQTGDTYTLTTANSSVGSRSGLEYFFNPSPSASTTHTHIFTNNFWPMDAATNKTDPLMGAINSAGKCDILVNGFWDAQNTVGGSHDGVAVPISDDGQAHNWFFGMNFSLSFTLTEDYLGPLEYIFFGDDDMWVFLDNQLICDIGGVHSSVGEYVNLRDYLPNGSSGQHTLSFFYTERGASGSTCWMSFTLPSVTSATTGRDIGSLQIAKSVKNTNGLDYSGEEYEFKVDLQTSESGSGLGQTFSYARSDGTFGTVKSGGTIKLRAGESSTIKGIPAGTFYRVTEVSRDGYQVTANGSEGYIVSGTIETGAVKPASFVNRPYHELPNSGGAGTTLYTIGGLALLLGAGILLYIHKTRGKEDSPSS